MSVIRRLPRYYRFLREMRRQGETRTSSKELSERMGFTASQIRQDFNCFGGFGQQGYGYNVSVLCEEIEKILGLHYGHKSILVGAGNLGRVIAAHVPFERLGFELAAAFDTNPELFGKRIGSLEILDAAKMEDYITENAPVMAILCVPKEAVHSTVKSIYELGLRNFWNFSHYDITLEFPDATVENVHLNDSIMTLCYKISAQIKPDSSVTPSSISYSNPRPTA